MPIHSQQSEKVESRCRLCQYHPSNRPAEELGTIDKQTTNSSSHEMPTLLEFKTWLLLNKGHSISDLYAYITRHFGH